MSKYAAALAEGPLFEAKHTSARIVQGYPLEMGISRNVASRAQGQGSKGEAEKHPVSVRGVSETATSPSVAR